MGLHIESAARHPSTIGVVRRDFRPDLPGAADRLQAVVDARRFAVNPLGRHDVAPFSAFTPPAARPAASADVPLRQDPP